MDPKECVPFVYRNMVDASLHHYIYSPPPALLQRRYSAEGHEPNRFLDWSVMASVLILSVASRLGVFLGT